MKYIEIVTDAGHIDTVSAIAEQHEVPDFRVGAIGEDGRQSVRLLVADNRLQPVLDSLQVLFKAQPSAQVVVLPVEIALPRASEEERREEDAATTSREALYSDVEKNARLDHNYVILVLLSTTVAAIGLIKNNLAVVIGAMVIAPLLGPNLAFGLGTALGDIPLLRKSAKTNLAGILLAVSVSAGIGFFWQIEMNSQELLSRTDVGLDAVTLALASGAAASLSLMTGLSSVLVGVMVAVALLPPAVTAGIMLGHGDYSLAYGAALLLAVNLVCINLASNLVFFMRGVMPRTWREKKKARRAILSYVALWVVLLLALVLLMR